MSSRRGRWISWMVVAVVVLAGAAAAAFVVVPMLAHRDAEQRYETATADWRQSHDDWEAQRTTWGDAQARAQEASDLADAVTSEAVLPYLPEDLVAEVRRAAEGVAAASEGVPGQGAPEAPEPDPKTTDELIAASDALRGDAARYEEAADRLAELAPQLADGIEELRAAIPGRAAAIEEANISSTAQSRIQLHYAAETAATSEDSVDYYVEAYAEAAEAVERSQREELAEKDQGDDLLETRLEVEEFVRSITGGVRVDFDWNPIVNDLGEGDSAGGRVTWRYLDGGSATMELSNSIAAHWPDPRYESLVAHESGHVITAKCQDLLVDAFEGDAELMATAWAIGMGYTDAWGNGVNFYYDGVAPAEELVESTLSCR